MLAALLGLVGQQGEGGPLVAGGFGAPGHPKLTVGLELDPRQLALDGEALRVGPAQLDGQDADAALGGHELQALFGLLADGKVAEVQQPGAGDQPGLDPLDLVVVAGAAQAQEG